MSDYCFAASVKMKIDDGQYHIVKVSKKDLRNKARDLELFSECGAVVEDRNPYGDECLDEDQVRTFAAELENEGRDVCSECISEFYGAD